MASEKLLEEDSLCIHHETLRLWLKQAGLWQPHRQRKAHRSRRARRARFGELLQLDGSIHAWFEGVPEKQCLMNMVDDATGKTLAIMDYGETTRAAFALLKWWIINAGIPLAIYVDLKSLYVSPKSSQYYDDDYVEPEWLTHFSKACKKLGIEIIKAYSPQAKGRVERNHAVYQDRFVKELKLRKIVSIAEANALLSGGFVNKLNEKFAKPAQDAADAHVVLTEENDLEQILCWEFTRKVKNDWTVQFDNQYYQIEKDAGVQSKQEIKVRQHLDDSISLWYKETRLAFHAIDKPSPIKKITQGIDPKQRARIARESKDKTPWNQFNPTWLSPSRYQKNKKGNDAS